MNEMDKIDNELQEMFAAKRTQTANQRRQEELRKLIEARAAADMPAESTRTRRMWPVWTGAAAAAVVLLLLTLPALFGGKETMPTLVAETEVPEMVLPQAEPTEPVATKRAGQTSTPGTPFHTDTSNVPSTPSQVSAPIIPNQDSTPDQPFEEPIIETILETATPAPRVIRRQSTLIACTEGCKTPEGTAETSSRNVQINFFSNDNYADATVYSIPIKK